MVPDKKKVRLIATGLVGVKNKEIIDSVLGQLSDGIWENSPRMETYWKFMDSEIAPDGTVFISVSTDCCRYDSYHGKYVYNKMVNADEKKICEFFAKKIKQVVKEAMKWECELGKWKRDNQNVFEGYIGYTKAITVADTYAAYDTLLGRKVKPAA